LTCLEHHLTIEDKVRIHSQAFIPEYSWLKTGCWIGPNVVITNAKYPCSKNVKANLYGAIIEERAKIGANVTLLPGVKIGQEALIGAGSVVVKDVDKFQVMVGNPARLLSDVRNIAEYQI
jgi:acetyltransferase-like isoleucine patch superfamily enzyme